MEIDSARKERRMDPRQRKNRMVLGTASVPAGVIVCWVLHEFAGVKELPEAVALAIGSAMGSLITTISICFQDLRGIFLSRFKSKRSEDS